ncbi:hypothetical protein AB4077_20620 [Vibrio cyclitrophicus]|uniref:Uncharacterized protein n=2 Tax=Vibrio cyclitrophicus TaxID=47951 RepID=A0A7Z1MLZ6_9VIBR|nr:MULTISPECIES: hypothetical protein [Vibrio]MBY7660113.1 hypothetical protein [Vibrio atlanticus]MBE8556317.1 hypothetical protein [Vibrio sp. OPT24]MCC4774105.1 hypothetical protein [Vibrio cyclitrophicus]MCC4840661.1 hypothetical protein [Vibrio cyclitrophicus]NOH18462.1 hypothetical protein [Vibrio cyclitrophicus]|tara:strand:+ start:1596 stop:1829 length:234 start_codon:yes stop_codon:yes gene_type:complete
MKMTPQRNKVINIAAAISIVLFSAIPTYASADHLDCHYLELSHLETSYLDDSFVEFITPDFVQEYLNDKIKENLILE